MKRNLLVLILLLALAITVFAREFAATFSCPSGSAQRLSTLLDTAGYSGSMTLDALTTCNPETNTADLYRGQSNVDSTNSFVLHPGDCYTEPAGARPPDPTQIYYRVYTTQNVTVVLRER